jgi:acetylornithine deacetylase/succinyl-diaminopimelate desuccinylase-like protein
MSAIYSLMLLAANGIVPPFSVVVLGVTCEEIPDLSKRGILKAIRRYGLARENTPLVIVLEATNMKVATGQRQRWTGEIEVYGPGVHSAHVYQNEAEWVRNRNSGKIDAFLRFPDLRALVSKASCDIRAIPISLPNGDNGKLRTSITLREIYEGTTGNQTPSSGILSFDTRLGDRDMKDEIGRRIREILNAWLPSPFGFNWNQEKDNCTGIADFLASDVGNEIRTLLERLRPFFDLFGATPTTYEFGVDGRYTVEAGIPTIGLAPGEEHYAHRTFNHLGAEPAQEMLERIRISELFRAIVVYAMLIQLCTYHRSYEGVAEIRPEAHCFSNLRGNATNTYVM